MATSKSTKTNKTTQKKKTSPVKKAVKKTKRKAKKAVKTIAIALVLIAILAVGLVFAPSIGALEGSVYNVNLEAKQEVKVKLGNTFTPEYSSSFDYVGVINKDLTDSVEVVIKDASGNVVDKIDTSAEGTYTITYTVKYKATTKTVKQTVKVSEASTDKLEIHFIDPTSAYAYAGDAIYIKAGDTDILIDGGTRKGSAAIIEAYIDQYCTDKTLEYVIATHADQDHIAAFVGTSTAPSIFEYYKCEMLIDFALSDKTSQLYADYQTKRQAAVDAGMIHYTAAQCYNETDGAKSVYEIGEGITMTILYNYYYEHSSKDENNYSVCVLVTDTVNDKNFYLLGDLEGEGEEKMVEHYNGTLPQADLYKANHHGSNTSSSAALLAAIQPKNVVFTCVAGSPEYTKDIDRIFPTSFAIDRLAKYTKNMYCLGCEMNGEYQPLNGNIIVTCENGEITIKGTNNNTLLQDTAWFSSTVAYYNTHNSNGDVQMIPDDKHPGSDGKRKWRTWPADGVK